MTKAPGQNGDSLFIRRVLIVLGLGSLFLLAWLLRELFLTLFGAVVVATIFRSIADRICRLAKIGDGVALKVIDMSHISHPKLLRHLRDLAEANDIPYQLEVLPHGGTDAAAMQRAKAGSVATTLSIPTRYAHTVNEIAGISDIEATIDLLVAYLQDAGNRDYSYLAK